MGVGEEMGFRAGKNGSWREKMIGELEREREGRNVNWMKGELEREYMGGGELGREESGVGEIMDGGWERRNWSWREEMGFV